MSSSDKVQLLKVLEPQHDQRLDNFLLRRMKGVPRSRIYWLVRKGEVRVNKKRCKPDRKLALGDEVRIPPFTGEADRKPGKPGPGLQALLQANVLYEDEHLLVLNKPAGLSVHGGSGVRVSLIDALQHMKPEWQTLELAHRLDRDTSGCLVIAKNTMFLKHIQNEFKVKNVNKHYLALVHGSWPQELEEVEAPLLKQELSGGERIVKVMAEGKPSKTRFAIRQRFATSTLVEAMPETGRTHQIRVHCQHSGHPIVGDSKYGIKPGPSALSRVKTLCLHASSIQFQVPHLGRMLEVSAPLDKSLEGILAGLK